MPVRKGMSFRERAVVKARMASAVLLSPVKKQARYHANSIHPWIHTSPYLSLPRPTLKI